MTRSAILFDLDGTLVDSLELILSAARHAFIGFSGRAPTDDEWRATIGRPLLAALRDYSSDEDEVNRLLTRYRAYQIEHHDSMIRAYDGIPALLAGLSAEGHALALVTSKADWLARKALDLVGITSLFGAIVGCDTCVNHKPHPEPVERALALLGMPAERAVFVGDTPHDVISGRDAHVFTIGVTWGACSIETLELSKPDVIVSTVSRLESEIRDFIGK